MASKKSQSYNAVLRELKKEGLSHTQARAAWGSLKERLGKSPTTGDLKAHPRITAQEVKRAPARERAIRGAATRAENKAKKAAAVPPAEPPARIIPPKRAAEILDSWEEFDLEGFVDDPDGS
jgi:hypothetical protein